MGTETSRASHVIDAMAARWSRYQGWGIKELVDALATEGVRVPSTNRVWPVDPGALRDVLASRDE
jgi:S-DNA-T family DNA segregation ATPase FtsK/SpoIIIE